jgi:D-alanine transaminase
VLDRWLHFRRRRLRAGAGYRACRSASDEHLAALERSLAAVRIRNPYSRANGATSSCSWRKQSFRGQGIYFQVTRGVAKRDHAFRRTTAPTVFMMSKPLVQPSRKSWSSAARRV